MRSKHFKWVINHVVKNTKGLKAELDF